MAEVTTIYTDASCCSTSFCGGWGCWVKQGAVSFTASGAFKDKVKDSTDAEMRAIANALAIVTKRLQLKGLIVIVTDSQMSIDIVSGRMSARFQKKRPDLVVLRDAIAKLVPPGCSLKLNKVKAHNRKDGARSYVNGVVDKLARNAMRKHRAGVAG